MANFVISWSDICWWVGSGSRGSFRDQGLIIWLLHLLRSPVKSSSEDCQPREEKELDEVTSAFHHYGRGGSLGNTLWDEDLCSGRFWGSALRIKPVKEWKKPAWAEREAELWCSQNKGLSWPTGSSGAGMASQSCPEFRVESRTLYA